MQTLRIRVSDSIFSNFIHLLEKFKKDEIEIITEDEKFISVQNYLQQEFNEINEGQVLCLINFHLNSDSAHKQPGQRSAPDPRCCRCGSR